jgi:hypothetical protein
LWVVKSNWVEGLDNVSSVVSVLCMCVHGVAGLLDLACPNTFTLVWRMALVPNPYYFNNPQKQTLLAELIMKIGCLIFFLDKCENKSPSQKLFMKHFISFFFQNLKI